MLYHCNTTKDESTKHLIRVQCVVYTGSMERDGDTVVRDCHTGTVLLLVTFVELLNRALWIKGACNSTCNGMYQIQYSLSLLLARSRVGNCFGASKEKKHANLKMELNPK